MTLPSKVVFHSAGVDGTGTECSTFFFLPQYAFRRAADYPSIFSFIAIVICFEWFSYAAVFDEVLVACETITDLLLTALSLLFDLIYLFH